jgi:hypothetical protein
MLTAHWKGLGCSSCNACCGRALPLLCTGRLTEAVPCHEERLALVPLGRQRPHDLVEDARLGLAVEERIVEAGVHSADDKGWRYKVSLHAQETATSTNYASVEKCVIAGKYFS